MTHNLLPISHNLFAAVTGLNPTLAVAVSGGADSMALLLLAHEWAKEKNGKAVALTVDHGLRPESADEAALVHEWCKKRGIEQHTLTFPLPLREGLNGSKNDIRMSFFNRSGGRGFLSKDSSLDTPSPQPSPSRGEGVSQATAREARYHLLADWCKQHHILHLLTGHHQGDQAETLFFRLARGSGIEGLACISPVSDLDGIRLIRPLLGVPKSALEAMLKAEGQPWIEDPSNKNPKYTRNRIRAAINACDNPGEISRRAADLAERFGRIRNVMEQDLARRLPGVVDFSPDGGFLHLAPFLQLPPVYGLKVLSILAQQLGNKPYPPRSEKTRRLYDDIAQGRIRKQRSFSGLLFIAKKNGLLIRPEPKRLEKSTITQRI